MRLGLLALASSLLLMMAGTARADDIFTITNGMDTISFTLPASPASPQTSCGRDPGFCFDATPITIDAQPAASTVTFYNSNDSGGLSLTGSYGGNTSGYLIYGFDSGQALFSGYDSAPTFIPGTYTIDSYEPIFTPAFSGDLTLKIQPESVSGVPEPSSLALLGTGLSGFGVAFWRRRRS